MIFALFSAVAGGILAFTFAWFARQSMAFKAFAVGMAILVAESIFLFLTARTDFAATAVKWQTWKITATSFLPGVWLLFSLTYARGNYREFLRKWKFAIITAFLLPPGVAILFRNSLLSSSGAEMEKTWMLGSAGFLVILLFLIGAVLVLMNLERTYRASVGIMRWRIKFMVLGLGVLFAVRAYSSSQFLLFRSVSLSFETVDAGGLLLACGLIFRSLTRTGRFEVSVYPSQSVLHHSFTVLLAGIYLLLVGVLAKVVTFLGGDSSFAVKAFVVLVCLVLLTMLLLSDRVRLFINRFVSRHFQRPLHDYRTVWRTFTDRTARCVEKSDLCVVSAQLVAEVFQALSVTVWLVDENKARFTFGSSTSLSAPKAASLAQAVTDAGSAITALNQHPDPIDIDSSKETWATTLRQLHPAEFQKGGNRICAPLMAGGELLGIIMVGDRVGGGPFSLQDFDLLKSISDQAAASLLNIQLSQRLTQAKQLEAFQAMSTFFVHDLKNTASMLSLMLQNLPVHFNDPKFREDALRGVSKTAAHINDLISRLSLLRQGLSLKPVEADLNELINKSLVNWPQTPEIEIIKELQALPRVFLDPEQIQNVVTNLVLNAQEALGQHGQIKITTSQNDGWIILTVADNGCGMNPEFVEKSLFRPFQTTKKKGIGIGMFQCKMIVEAHRGRIEVKSELGKGTAFRLMFPIAK